MMRWQRAYVVAMCAVIGGAFAYAACVWGQWPCLTFLPVSGDLVMSPPAGSLTITYPGIVAWGAGGAAVGALVGAGLCIIARKPWPDRALHLFGAWAITAVLLAGSYFTWSVWPW